MTAPMPKIQPYISRPSSPRRSTARGSSWAPRARRKSSTTSSCVASIRQRSWTMYQARSTTGWPSVAKPQSSAISAPSPKPICSSRRSPCRSVEPRDSNSDHALEQTLRVEQPLTTAVARVAPDPVRGRVDPLSDQGSAVDGTLALQPFARQACRDERLAAVHPEPFEQCRRLSSGELGLNAARGRPEHPMPGGRPVAQLEVLPLARGRPILVQPLRPNSAAAGAGSRRPFDEPPTTRPKPLESGSDCLVAPSERTLALDADVKQSILAMGGRQS